jgi:hypothetical protein
MQSLVQDAPDKQAPVEYRLYQNFPQTFYKVTRIGFDIPETIDVKLAIYDVFGRSVCVLVNNSLKEGSYEVVWTAGKLNPGIYYYKIIAGEFVDSRKVFLLGK